MTAEQNESEPRIKICGYCGERTPEKQAKQFALDFGLGGERRRVRVWFCSLHCCFWAGAKHGKAGFATTIRSLRHVFGAAVEVLK